MFQRLLLRAIVAGSIAASGCKPSVTEFTSLEYKFKASFPGTPKEQEKTAAGAKVKTFLTESRNGGYIIGVADLPIPANEPDAQVQNRLDGARDGAIRNVNGTLKASAPTTLGKYPGREFTAAVTAPVLGQYRARLFLVGPRLYQVAVMGTDSFATSAEATAFLNSFQLLP